MKRQFAGELISEAVALLIIISFGDSVAAMYSLYDPSPYQHAYWGVCIAWGLAVTIAIYTTGSISGCHANPAVTLSLALYRKFPWKKVLPYCIAQTIGAIAGACIVYLLFTPVIDRFNLANQFTRAGGGAAGVFFTHPALGISVMHAFSDEIILTAFLVFGIFAITEQYNEMAPGANFGALIIGFLVAAIGASMGYLEAWAINPARDFGPRLFAFFAGKLLVGSHRRPAARRSPGRRSLPAAHPSLPARAPPRPARPGIQPHSSIPIVSSTRRPPASPPAIECRPSDRSLVAPANNPALRCIPAR
jgi:glycerol uptake facilitator protein